MRVWRMKPSLIPALRMVSSHLCISNVWLTHRKRDHSWDLEVKSRKVAPGHVRDPLGASTLHTPIATKRRLHEWYQSCIPHLNSYSIAAFHQDMTSFCLCSHFLFLNSKECRAGCRIRVTQQLMVYVSNRLKRFSHPSFVQQKTWIVKSRNANVSQSWTASRGLIL